MRLWGLLLLAGLIVVPGVSACSFIAEAAGGNDVRVHDIRSGSFGFAGTTEYSINMGDGEGWWDLGTYSSGTPDAFVYEYAASGTYTITLDCNDLDNGVRDDSSVNVTVGGFLGLPSWFWPIVLGIIVVIIVAGQRKKTKARRQMTAIRRQPLSTATPRRRLGCFPDPGVKPTILAAGNPAPYDATAPDPAPMDALDVDSDDETLELEWQAPDGDVRGYELYEERLAAGAPEWQLRERFEPDVTELEIDRGNRNQGPYRVIGYRVNPIVMGADGTLLTGAGVTAHP